MGGCAVILLALPSSCPHAINSMHHQPTLDPPPLALSSIVQLLALGFPGSLFFISGTYCTHCMLCHTSHLYLPATTLPNPPSDRLSFTHSQQVHEIWLSVFTHSPRMVHIVAAPSSVHQRSKTCASSYSHSTQQATAVTTVYHQHSSMYILSCPTIFFFLGGGGGEGGVDTYKLSSDVTLNIQ